MNTAHFIKEVETNLGGYIQRLFKLSPPYKEHSHCIITERSTRGKGPETHCVPATPEGEIAKLELLSGINGSTCTGKVLEKMGYTWEKEDERALG